MRKIEEDRTRKKSASAPCVRQVVISHNDYSPNSEQCFFCFFKSASCPDTSTMSSRYQPCFLSWLPIVPILPFHPCFVIRHHSPSSSCFLSVCQCHHLLSPSLPIHLPTSSQIDCINPWPNLSWLEEVTDITMSK